MNENLAVLLWDAARRAPGRDAIVDRTGTHAYEQLRARAAAIAESLRAHGIQRNDRVALFLERSAEAAASLFGIHAAGGIAVVVNDRLRPRQIEHVLRHSGARLLLASADLLARQPRPVETDARVLHLENIPSTGDVEPVTRVSGDVAQIIYTSGSTGLPKGVTFTHGQLSTGVRLVTSYLGLREDDRLASLLPFSSVYGLNQLLCATRMGGTLIVESSPVPQQIATNLRAHGVSVIAAVPPLWLQLLSAPAFVTEQIPTLRMMQNAGGHLPPHTARQLRAAQPQAELFLQYGMTETFRSTYLPPDEFERHPDSMGRAIPGTEIMVLREDLTPCDPGEIGELVHRGPTVSAGYWNDPETTARVFRPNPLRPAGTPDSERVVFSGDMVRRDEEGFLYFVSRRDRMIKTLGFRVGPDEIADVLFAAGEISECVVSTEPDEQRGERIVAFVVLERGGSMDRLTKFCRAELPRHMQPARIVALDHLPRLVSGKYDLPAIHQASAAAAALA